MGNFTKKTINSANLNQNGVLLEASKNIPSILKDLVENPIILQLPKEELKKPKCKKNIIILASKRT